MFLYSPFRHDSRVTREALALVAAGHEVRVIAAHDAGTEAHERREGFEIVRVARDPLPTRLVRRLLAHRRPAPEPEEAGPAVAERPVGLVLAERVLAVRRAPNASPAGRLAARALELGLGAHIALEHRRWHRNALRAAAAEPADVWIAHDLETLATADRARSRHGGALVYDSHELFLERDTILPLRSRARRALARRERRLIRRADAVVTVSESIAAELARRYEVPRPSVVLNVPSRPRQGAETAAPDLRDALGVPPERGIALYLGGIQEQRPLDHLVRAAARLERAVMVLMGPAEPSYRAALERVAEQAGATGNLRFAPAVDPELVVAVAAGADVGVVPFRRTSMNQYLALPNKVFEYIAAGLPVVGSDFPEIGRVIEEHGIGLTFDPDDEGSIAAAIDRLLADPAERARMRERTRAAAEVLSWEREEPKYLRIVEGAAGLSERRTTARPRR